MSDTEIQNDAVVEETAAPVADEPAAAPAPAASEEAEVEVPAKFKKLVEEVESMSVLELNELVKVLEKKFGVSAVAVAAAPAAGAGAAEEAFVVNNSTVDANDVVVVSTTYAGAGKPIVFVTNQGSGVFTANITNVSASALDAVCVINFAVIKSVTS